MRATAISASPLPTLWTSDPIAAQCLSSCFRIAIAPEEIAPGHHIIALQSEVEIRQLVAKLSQAGASDVQVYQLDKPIEHFLFGEGRDAAPMILMGALPYEQWLESVEDAPLGLKEAVALAEHIIKCEPDSPERNIALDMLGRRAGVSEYNWDKKYLASIREKLEQTFAFSSSKTNDTKERLRLDVLALLKESDPVSYEVMRADIQSRYRLNGKALERIISSISQRTKEAEVEDLGLDELFDLPCDNIEYVVPGMLPVGEAALLIANPKAGKSLLAYDAAFAVATGEDTFLGERCKQGKVLIVQCDESTGTAKGRLLKRGFRREDALNVRFMHKFSISQLGALESKLETFRPTLVIIDSLRRINAGREVSENSAEFSDNIYQLKELCAQYNAGLILIHHSNKNSEAVGVEKVRGSSAIAGAVWGVWELSQIPKPDPNNKKKLIIDPKDPTRILSIIARDVEGQRLQIELDPENNHWLNHGQQGISEEEVNEHKTHSARVVELLKSVAPAGLEACEINERLGIGRGIYSILNRLLGQKIIGSRPSDKDRRRTVYFCSTVTRQQPDNPPPPTDTDPNAIEYAETIGISTVQSSIAFDHNSIAFDHKTLADEWDEQASNVEPESHTVYSITSAPLGGGGGKKELESVTVEPSEFSSGDEAIAPPPTVNKSESSASDSTVKGQEQLTPVEQTASTSGDEAHAPSPAATPGEPDAPAPASEEADLWMEESTIAEIAGDLANESFCDSKATLAILRTVWDARAMNLACKRLSPQRHSQIMAWVLQLNAEAQQQLEEIQVGDRVFANCCPHTDRLGPYLVERIEGEFAKVEMFPQLLSVSDLRRG